MSINCALVTITVGNNSNSLNNISTIFNLFEPFHNYVVTLNKHKVIEEGFVRDKIQFEDIGLNSSGFYYCPKLLLEKLILEADCSYHCVLPFKKCFVDGATLSNSGTQCGTCFRVSYSIVQEFSETM